MKKTVICIVSTAAAFVLATALNIQNMIWGGTPSVLGLVFSLVFCACLFVLPVVAKNRLSLLSRRATPHSRRLLQQSDCSP